MPPTLTDSVRCLIADSGATAVVHDIYSGDGPRLYDELVGRDRSEVREVLALARRTGGPVLDLAAGSGRLTVPLVRSGHDVVALDSSPDMLGRLRRTAPADARVEVVVADMRSFEIERRFALVVLGATSVSLLDPSGRAALFETVRRHLAPGGVFALSVAGAVAAAGLSRSEDRTLRPPAASGDGAQEEYLQSQQVDAAAGIRIVNWLRPAELSPGRRVTVFTSRLAIVDEDTLARELVAAGFDEPVITSIVTAGLAPGAGMRMLETRASGRAGSPDAR